MYSALENRIIDVMRVNPAIDVAWLHGSRAVGSPSADSDFDVAVAWRHDAVGTTSEPALDDLQSALSLAVPMSVSVVDINRSPIPLARNIVAQGKVLLCRSDLRQRVEEQRIWSLWEEYKFDTTDRPYEAYVYAIREQVEQHLDGLDELREVIQRRPLTFIERNGLVRSLQVIVEAAIGCSKHFLKSRNKPVPSEARLAVDRVYETLALLEPPHEILRGAIGMRNAIIHDYLNLDWQRVETVLKENKYREIKQYVTVVSAQLLNP